MPFNGRAAPLVREVSLTRSLPLPGSSSAILPVERGDPLVSVPSDDARRRVSVQLLERVPHANVPASIPWTIFHSDVDVLHHCCTLHGVVVADDGCSGDALLRHFFTGFCALAEVDDQHLACWEICRGQFGCADVVSILIGSVLRPDVRYPTDRLSLIARAIGLVASGAGVERRRLVSMLEDFRTGCVDNRHEVVPEALFGGIEHVARGSLLSLGFAHGLTLSGDRDGMRDALVSHLSQGDCAAPSRGNRPQCLAVVRQYIMGTESCVMDVLRIRILEAVGQFIRLVPLRRLLRLHGVSSLGARCVFCHDHPLVHCVCPMLSPRFVANKSGSCCRY